MTGDTTYTVSELTRLIRMELEQAFSAVWVQGEISNFTRHSSGHFYFSLKDKSAQLSAVMWRGKNAGLAFRPQDGMKILAAGRVTVFEKRGIYQMDVDTLQPLGVGDLQIAFEQLKEKLAAEGLFDPARKRSIPPYCRRIGIVTSPTGAAIRDLISVAKRRYPGIELILYPVRVQGDGAAEEIARAIDDFNEYGGLDVLIVGRGGGSLEDLWAFNEEIVARAIVRSDIPVVSAVGHEIDFTIADFAADLRAPTPSAAAEIVVINAGELWEGVLYRVQRMTKTLGERFAAYSEKLRYIEGSRAFQAPRELLKQYAMQVDFLTNKMNISFESRMKNAVERAGWIEKRLHSLNPENVLKRGYSVTRRTDDGKIVSGSGEIQAGDKVTITFGRGSAGGTIDSVFK